MTDQQLQLTRRFLNLYPTNASSGWQGSVFRWYCPNCNQVMKKVRIKQMNPRYFCKKCNIEWKIL